MREDAGHTDPDEETKTGQRNERGTDISKGLGQAEASRDANDRGYSERGHDHTHCGATSIVGEDIANDRHHGRPQDATEGTRQTAGGDEPRVRGGQSTEQIAHGKARIHRKQHRLAWKAVEIFGGEQTRERRGDPVDTDRVAELLGIDAELNLGPGGQRHHDDEVENVRELDRRQKEQNAPFAAGNGGLRSRGRLRHYASKKGT